MTKMHEKYFRGKADAILKDVSGKKLKGEFVVLVAKENFLP